MFQNPRTFWSILVRFFHLSGIKSLLGLFACVILRMSHPFFAGENFVDGFLILSSHKWSEGERFKIEGQRTDGI